MWRKYGLPNILAPKKSSQHLSKLILKGQLLPFSFKKLHQNTSLRQFEDMKQLQKWKKDTDVIMTQYAAQCDACCRVNLTNKNRLPLRHACWNRLAVIISAVCWLTCGRNQAFVTGGPQLWPRVWQTRHHAYATYARHKYVAEMYLYSMSPWYTRKADESCIKRIGALLWRRAALGGDNKQRCLHVVWYRLLTVCQILIARSEIHSNEVLN